MLPIRDDVPTRRWPWLVLALGAANVAVYAYTLSLGWNGGDDGEAVTRFIETWGLVPRELLQAGDPRSWVTLVTAMFLHGSILHLGANLLYLQVFGSRVEDLLGPARFLLLYTVTGIVAGAAEIAAHPTSWVPTIGASGAVSGLLGAYLVSYPRGRLRLIWPRIRVRAALFLGLWVVFQVLSGLDTLGDPERSVAWWAHIGGFAAGAVLARPMWAKRPIRKRARI
jgi:membrane associated rhomboid family serine protease